MVEGVGVGGRKRREEEKEEEKEESLIEILMNQRVCTKESVIKCG